MKRLIWYRTSDPNQNYCWNKRNVNSTINWNIKHIFENVQLSKNMGFWNNAFLCFWWFLCYTIVFWISPWDSMQKSVYMSMFLFCFWNVGNSKKKYIYIYIYIYTERERFIYIYIYIYTHVYRVYTYIYICIWFRGKCVVPHV